MHERNILNVNINCLFNNNEPLSMELLENNIEVEKMEYQKGRYLKEFEIQFIVVEYLERKGLLFHPSMSGIYINSFETKRKMKKQGVRAGYPDIAIYHNNGTNNLFLLELKTKAGKLSEAQKELIGKLKEQNIAVSVSKGLYDAIYKIEKYLKGEPIVYENI